MRALALVVLSLVASSSAGIRAGDLLVSSRFTSKVLRFDAQTGTFLGVFAAGHSLANPNGIAYGPDGDLYVGNGDEGRVLRFDGQTGDSLGDFVVPATPGGLSGCRALVFGPDGDLYVDSGNTDNVLEYDGETGAFLRVAAQGNGLDGPVGLTFGPDGNLYVGAALSNRVYVFAPDGSFLRSFNCGFGFSNVTGVLFDAGGRLLVAGSVSNNVMGFDAATGTCLGSVASGSGLNIPIGMILAPDGNLLVGSFGTDSVLKFDLVAPPHFLGTLVKSGVGGLDGTHNFAYVPDLSCAQLPPDALGWWPGDGSAADLLSGHHGALLNGAAFAPGRSLDGFLFDGADDQVQVPDHPDLDPTGSFSIETWVKTASSAPPEGVLVGKNECGAACTPCVTNSLYALSLTTRRHAALRLRDDDPGCRSAQVLEGRAIVADTQWHQLVATRDVEAGTLSLYVDGLLDARVALSADADGPIADDEGDADPLTFGALVADGAGSASLPFAGQLDEVVWYRRALTECEVHAVFTTGGALHCKGDRDGDAVPDYLDNCPVDANTGQQNLDGDPRGDACDCAPSDPAALVAPGEVGRLEVGLARSKDRLEWCSMESRYGAGTTYDLVRGALSELPAGSGASETCLGGASASAVASDATLPAEGQGFWYLARGRNACGVGSYGFRRNGVERTPSACP